MGSGVEDYLFSKGIEEGLYNVRWDSSKDRESAGGAWEGSHRGKASAKALGLEARPVGGAGGARRLGRQNGQG